jgi:hypothetical protein
MAETELDQSEKIINDIVAMDAAFDQTQLPDLSIGKDKFTASSYSLL